MQVFHHIIVEVALCYFGLYVSVVFISSIELSNILLGGQEVSHLLLFAFLLLTRLVVLLLWQDQHIELRGWHLVPRMLIAYHLLKKHLLKAAKVWLAQRNIGSLQMSWQIWGRTIVWPNRNGFVISSQDNRGGPIIVNIRIVCIADSKEVGCHCEGNFFAFVDKGDPFAWGNIDGAV